MATMSVDLATLTDAELRAELERRKPPKQKPTAKLQVFYRVRNCGTWNYPKYEIAEITLQEEKRRWKVISGERYVNHRKYLLKSETHWRLHPTRKDALAQMLTLAAEAVADTRWRILCDRDGETTATERYHALRRELIEQHGLELDPLPDALRSVEARFRKTHEEHTRDGR